MTLPSPPERGRAPAAVALAGVLACAPVFAADTPVAGPTKRPAPHRHFPDGRLAPTDAVLGIVVGGEPRAYAVADLPEAGSVVHDRVAAAAVDVGVAEHAAPVVRTSLAVEERTETTWESWSAKHPDSSLWRRPAVAEGEAVRPASEIRVTSSRGYATVIGCAVTLSRMTAPNMEAPGLYVVSGSIENAGAQPVDHVVLRFELVDRSGRVVFRDEGFNRSAEELATPKPAQPGPVVPIAAGATDTFRMIFLSDELPDFEQARVTVARVYATGAP